MIKLSAFVRILIKKHSSHKLRSTSKAATAITMIAVMLAGATSAFAQARILDIHQGLATETTANLHWNDFDFRHRDIHEACRLVAHCEVALATRPDGETTITVPHSRAGMGLDVALVHGRCEGLLLHHDLGPLEAFVDIAQAKLEMIGQI